MQSEQENFLSRWSRRKQQAKLEPELPQTLEQEISSSQESGLSPEQLLEQETSIESVEEPILTDEDMPPIDSLTEDSDYSGFMSKGVSDELRNLALRKLFKASVFNVRDGLDEYDEDFTTFEKLGDIITCDMKHQMEVEAKKKLEREAEASLDDEIDEMEEMEEMEDDETLELAEDESESMLDTNKENAEPIPDQPDPEKIST